MRQAQPPHPSGSRECAPNDHCGAPCPWIHVLRSLPPLPSVQQGHFHSPSAEDPPPFAPPLTALACIDHVSAKGLRGALDWQSGRASSGVQLSIYTGSDIGPGWGTRLLDVSASAREHSVQHTPSGDRLSLQLNASRCFEMAPSGDDASILCFQVADLTQYGEHVRYVNRGCGPLAGDAQRQSINLNDGAVLELNFALSSTNAKMPSMPLVLTIPLIAFALAVSSCLVLRGPRGALVLKSMLRCCAGALLAAGFASLAAEISRAAASKQVRVARSRAAVRDRRRARARTVPFVPMIPNDEEILPAVHEITLDEAVLNQEDAIKRAMELISAVKNSPQHDVAAAPAYTPKASSVPVPNLAPPPEGGVPAGATSSPELRAAGKSPEGGLILADIASILAQSTVLSSGRTSDVIGEAHVASTADGMPPASRHDR